ncbi:hypothetical protein J1N35_043176 [Gossypium stocksii]|uniref:RNase H type-1 domain-containing protein n=1 Tax=Gossypium stocksii TaxID=47602 RepID=A0A9D3U6Y9_9ROSI|nr:hypothetical protein J1N35_043176 [Gossypium stocksii]
MQNEKRIFQSEESLQQICHNGGVMIHFDAAFNQLNFTAASSLLVLDEEGEVIASKSIIYSDIATPFAVEAHAGLEAIKLGIDLGVKKLMIYGDSRTVLKKCQQTNRDKSAIGALIRDIQQKKHIFEEIGFHFIPKLENTKAHEVAKQSLLRGVSFYLENGVSDYIRQAWESRRPRFPY